MIKDSYWNSNMNKNLSKSFYLQYLSNQSSKDMTNLDENLRNLQNLFQLKAIMNGYSNQQIPFFLPPMNNLNPLCSTGIFPYANSSRVRSDHFFDTIMMIIILQRRY